MTFTNEDLKRLKEDLEIPERTMIVDEHEMRAILARLDAHEAMADFIAHDDPCIRNRNSQGRPTDGGGYECMYDGKWYRTRPVDETPKCNCGLDELWEAWRKAAGR